MKTNLCAPIAACASFPVLPCLGKGLVSTSALFILCLVLVTQGLHGVTPALWLHNQLSGTSLPRELFVLTTASLLCLETRLWIKKTEEFIQQNQLQEPDFVCKVHASFKLQVWPPERKQKQLLSQDQCEPEAQTPDDVWLCKLRLHAQIQS